MPDLTQAYTALFTTSAAWPIVNYTPSKISKIYVPLFEVMDALVQAMKVKA